MDKSLVPTYKYYTIQFYNQYAKKYDQDNQELHEITYDDAMSFVDRLPGKKILDVGCGNGRDLKMFVQLGYEPTGIDLSEKMVAICKDKGFDCIYGDMEEMPFDNESFDGVWALASLIHIPKDNVPVVVEKIHNLLKKNGLFYIGMKMGSTEQHEESKSYPGAKRYVSRFTLQELQQILEKHFIILKYGVFKGSDEFVNFLCTKK